jgi:hypothetical protein
MFYLLNLILSLPENDVIRLGLDKAQAGGYKIYAVKFLGYAALILLLALSLVPGAIWADG